MTKDEKELFEEKIGNLSKMFCIQFNHLNEKLDAIHEQTIKTNSRVTHLEEFKEKAEVVIATRVTKDMYDKQTEKIEKYKKETDDNLKDVNFYIRHPKLFIATISLIVILSIATFFENNTFLKKLINDPPKTEQVQSLPSK